MVPLSNFAEMMPAPGVDKFVRFNGTPIETIRADVAQGVYADAMVAKIARLG